MKQGPKSILVLARRDNTEAMRVAAGLSVTGHAVDLVFVGDPIAETEENAAMAELLEMSGIAPRTAIAEMAGELPFVDAAALARALAQSDAVINV
jgi:hypothetical protein